MKLTWLGTAAFEIVIEETVLLLDPYVSRNAQARPALKRKPQDILVADYIFLSHGHFDHASDVPLIAARTGARVFASSPVCDTLRRAGLPDHQLRPLGDIETLGFSHFRVLTIPASHIRFDRPLLLKTLRRAGWHMIRHWNLLANYPAGDVLAYLFTVGNQSLCFFGSASYDPARIKGLAPDLALIPVQGHTDICRIAAEMTAHLSPRWVIPHHHDNFWPPFSQAIDLAPFVAEVEKLSPATRVHIPEIGRELTFEKGELH